MATIIGIHGLANKPAELTLTKWWKDALEEGLKQNMDLNPGINFELVYWADQMYDASIPDHENKEKYYEAGAGALKRYKDGWRDDLVAGLLNVTGGAADFAKSWLDMRTAANAVLEAKLNDLYLYYTDTAIRDALRNKLKRTLSDHKGSRTMLIAHSMGSIFAYDVLRQIGREDPTYRLDHFVTIGSPLGLPHVIHTIREEGNGRLVRTPSVVKKWINFADRFDPVALDVHLSGDFEANDRGVEVVDDMVSNDYEGIHHKSYGYLRTPELSEAVARFI